MNKGNLFIYTIILLCSISLYTLLYSNNHSTGSSETNELNEHIVYLQDSIANLNECIDVIESDERLRQHFLAVKYSELEPSKENIKEFLIAADVLNQEESFAVALRETANGKTGIGRSHANNHFGMRRAAKRFTWGEGLTSNNYVKYQSWTFSYLDYDEFLKVGNKTWRKDLPNNLVKNKKSTNLPSICNL